MAVAVLTVPLVAACGGDLPETGASANGESGLAGETAAAEAGREGEARRRGTLSVVGAPLTTPGDYVLNTSCSYARGDGSFSFGLHPDVDDQVKEGASTFGVRAGWGSRTSIPLEDGTYGAEFEYTELTGDGPIRSYAGEAEMSIRVVDDSRESFPLVEVEASGEGEGVHFQARGICQAMVMG